ncbi:MAG: AAA family ATPase [Burkholderiales bacterium]|nr:AAA family ATPase [Burkholderiales bacterium]
MSVIFLAGVHGVGKGFLGTPAAQTLGMSHFTASQLIREEKGRATWGQDKKAVDLDDNQQALIRAVALRQSTHNAILLDGHFVLRNAQGILVPLEQKVFAQLQLCGVILLSENTGVIANRLRLRDSVDVKVVEIAELADAEIRHARIVCAELGLPLTVIHAPTEMNLCAAIQALLSGCQNV